MVSKDRSRSSPVSARKPSSFVTVSISSGGVVCPSVASQWRKRATAAPSRTWAERAPATSTGFFAALGRAHGSAPRSTMPPAAATVSKYQAEALAGSSSTRLPASAFRAGTRASGGRSSVALPSQAGRSSVTFPGSRNSLAWPSAPTMAWPRGRGERITSPPRMLNSQASEVGPVSTVTSAPASAMAWEMRVRLAAAASPDMASGCGTTGARGWGGRSAQARSRGLGSTATRRAPARWAAAFSRSRLSGVCRRAS